MAAATNAGIVYVENDQEVASAYETWNNDYCDVQRANDVAEAIRNYANSLRTNSVKYIVVAGSDEIIPFYRVPDEVKIARESEYALTAEASLIYTSPLIGALGNGFILTDDFFVDDNPLLWRGRALFVPDLAIGRLVETPGEITTVIDKFLTPEDCSSKGEQSSGSCPMPPSPDSKSPESLAPLRSSLDNPATPSSPPT